MRKRVTYPTWATRTRDVVKGREQGMPLRLIPASSPTKQVRVSRLVAASGRCVAEDDTLGGNVVSHLSSDSEESRGPSSLVAERDGQRRR